MHSLILILIIFSILSCSEKQSERNRNTSDVTGEAGQTQIASVAPGSYALEITPKAVSRGSTVNLIFTGFVVQDSKIEWLLNGELVESPLPYRLVLSEASKGDMLQARARIQDREILSNQIEIGNAPPVITSFKLLTEVIKPGDALGVAVMGSDVDGDNVTFLYEWTINGQPAGNEDKIEGLVKRGDSVVVKVTPYDGESYGSAIVQNREIQNQPPVIQEHGEFQFDGTVYTYQVKAADPDGDTLTYALKSQLEGMKIDKSLGLITWIVPTEFKGSKSVFVVATDGLGGSAQYVLDITIQ